MASALLRKRQKEAEHGTAGTLGENRFLAPLRLFLLFIFFDLDSSADLLRAISSQHQRPPLATAAQPGASNQPARASGSPSSSESGDSYHSNPWGPAESDEDPYEGYLISYSHADLLVFHRERDEAREELGDVSKKFGIEQAEWEDQRKQLCDAVTSLIFSV
jgi:hypothetical protein